MNDIYESLKKELPYLVFVEDGTFYWDTDDTTSDEQTNNRYDLQEILKDLGWEIIDIGSDHDTIWGKLKRIEK